MMEFSVSWKTGILVYFRNTFRHSLLLMFSWNRNKSSDLQSKLIDWFLYQEIIRKYSISCQYSHSIPLKSENQVLWWFQALQKETSAKNWSIIWVILIYERARCSLIIADVNLTIHVRNFLQKFFNKPKLNT